MRPNEQQEALEGCPAQQIRVVGSIWGGRVRMLQNAGPKALGKSLASPTVP